MQNSSNFLKFFYKNIYLLVIAAWLITISFIIDNYWSKNATLESAQKQINKYVQEQEKDFALLTNDGVTIHKIVSKDFSEEFLKEILQKKYFFYLYQSSGDGLHSLLFWNTQTVQPSETLINTPDSVGFVTLQNGYYVYRKRVMDNRIAFALIPVKWNFVITNEYLENSFAIGKGLENNYNVTNNITSTPVNSISGLTLFYLTKTPGELIPKNTNGSVLLRLVSVLLVFLFVHFWAIYIVAKRGLWQSFLFLTLMVFSLRLLSYYFPIPLNFRQFELFDPAIYGSNAVLRSLGDLLINALLATWVILFIRYQILEKKYSLPLKLYQRKWILLFIAAIILIETTFIGGKVLRSLVVDSQISFDVINFFTQDLDSVGYSFVAFLILCCVSICYFLLAQVILYFLKPLFPQNFNALYIMVSVVGLAILTIGFNSGTIGFKLFLLLWLILFLILLSIEKLSLISASLSSTRLVFWLFFFSVSITMIIVKENNEKELNNRKHYAVTLSTKADPSSETLMNTLLSDFRNEFLAANFYKFRLDSTNQQFKDSLVSSNFSGYTDNYDTKIYTFDEHENALFNRDFSSYNELNTILKTQAKPTSIKDLFYYDESYDRFSYISKRNIADTSGNILGYVFILARSKKYKPDAPYPELFSRGNNNAIENSNVYSFAVYDNLRLISNHNDYAFATTLAPDQIPETEFENKDKNGYNELWYKAGPQNMVIIAKPNNYFLESTTLFSYLFCSFLVVATIFWLLNFFVQFWLNKNYIKSVFQFSIRNQIHGTIIFISIFSFVVIGIATIMFFIKRYQTNSRDELSHTIQIMENEVRNSLNELAVFDDALKIYDKGFRDKLEQSILKISEIHSADINLYDLQGNLQVSSLPLPYEKGIVSAKIDPEAFYHLKQLREVQFFKDETIGKLKFVSNYVPVLDANGKDYAYLNIPYFSSETKLKLEIANFLVTIINLNAFIFLISGIVALFITNRITNSFSFISNKMREVNLGQKNEAIIWKRNDEIGELVKEYNKMVSKLDESAMAMAKTERETAWREMARQVAHEIKNPLTPMKLSLQYLQKAISNNSENVKELTSSVAQTLVEQIGHLNQIAGEFSQFANIGNPRKEVFDLHEILSLVIQLYSVNDRLQLSYTPVAGPIFINADKTNINRLFTNLIQNASQAIPDDKIAIIKVEEALQGNLILIKVADNGIGISNEIASKIFTPNFTTKTSGTGLGLAMCRGIVEESKGRIWFETTPGEGTNFFVELPLNA